MPKTIKLSELKRQYEFVCNEYIQKFCNKHGIIFDFWIGNKVGQIAVLGDYSFDFSDIILDINTKQPKELIFNWYNETVDSYFDNPVTAAINYYSYTMGLRYEDLRKNKTK